jgi:elongation factor 1-gamma
MPPFATLHTSTSFLHARVTRALAAANLNGLEIYIPPNFQYGTTNKTPEYISKFPHGKIPSLETPSGFYLGEASAIAQFLAESGPMRDQLMGKEVEERALVQMWISFADTELWRYAGDILGPIMGFATYDKEYVDKKEAEFIRALKRMELHLEQPGKKFLVRDDAVSLADLSAAAALLWPLKFFMDPEYRAQYPKIMEWWERVMAIEEVGKAFEAPVPLCEVRKPNDGSYGASQRMNKP